MRIVTGPEGGVGGALYKPLEEIVPLALPPLTYHHTTVSAAPVTVAVNCFVVPAATEAVFGVIERTMPAPNSTSRGDETSSGIPGFVTVMLPLPDCDTLLDTRSSPDETNVVGNAVPSSFTTALLLKLVP